MLCPPPMLGRHANTHNNTKAIVRGFDVRTGSRLWRSTPSPAPLNSRTRRAHESWGGGTGTSASWNQIGVDEDTSGLAYSSGLTPISDFSAGCVLPGNTLRRKPGSQSTTGPAEELHFQLCTIRSGPLTIATAPMLVSTSP